MNSEIPNREIAPNIFCWREQFDVCVFSPSAPVSKIRGFPSAMPCSVPEVESLAGSLVESPPARAKVRKTSAPLALAESVILVRSCTFIYIQYIYIY